MWVPQSVTLWEGWLKMVKGNRNKRLYLASAFAVANEFFGTFTYLVLWKSKKYPNTGVVHLWLQGIHKEQEKQEASSWGVVHLWLQGIHKVNFITLLVRFGVVHLWLQGIHKSPYDIDQIVAGVVHLWLQGIHKFLQSGWCELMV